MEKSSEIERVLQMAVLVDIVRLSKLVRLVRFVVSMVMGWRFWGLRWGGGLGKGLVVSS